MNPIGSIFSSYFIQHITNGGAYVDKTMYSAQISDLISALIIYLCGFVLFFKVFMNGWLDRREEKRRAKEDASGSEEGGKAVMLLLLQYTLIFASVLLLVALGGLLFGALRRHQHRPGGHHGHGRPGGALMMKFLPAGTSAFLVVLLTVLASILLGLIYSLLLAVAAVNFKADQTLVGTAMNLLGTARGHRVREGHEHRRRPRQRVLHHPVPGRPEGLPGGHRRV